MTRFVTAAVETSDGGYLLGGSQGTGPGGDGNLVKIYPERELEWERTYGGTNGEAAYSVLEPSDGGYLFVGTKNLWNDSTPGVGWLVKLAGDGSEEWARTYAGDRDTWFGDVHELDDGGYLLVRNSGTGNERDLSLVSVDEGGRTRWARTYEEPSSTLAYSLFDRGDDGYLLVGAETGGDKWDALLVSVDGDGRKVGHATYGGGDHDQFESIVETSDGGYAIVGRKGADLSSDRGQAWLLKLGEPTAGGGTPGSSVDGGVLALGLAVGSGALLTLGGLAAYRHRSGRSEPADPAPESSDSGTDDGSPAGDVPTSPDRGPAPETGTATGDRRSSNSGVPDLDLSYDDIRKGDRIGSGGSADVYEATVDGQTVVALKEPRIRGTLDDDVVERFAREARTWSKLDDHDGIVGVVDWGTTPLPWIAMEYMDGGPLADAVGDLPFDRALWTATRIADAVYHAHRHGVAHFDLKPGNVLFRSVETAWDVPKVGDWGLAELMLDHSRDVEGYSPRYAAPEQLSDEYGSPDQLTDVYALGAVCYALFTGRPPFQGTIGQVVTKVLNEDPTPPTEVRPDLPDEVEAIVTTAMAKRKDERYDDVLLLREDLRELYEAL